MLWPAVLGQALNVIAPVISFGARESRPGRCQPARISGARPLARNLLTPPPHAACDASEGDFPHPFGGPGNRISDACRVAVSHRVMPIH